MYKRQVDRSSRELKISDEPQMRVTLEPTDVGENYFPATYKSSSVKISGGSFVSARRDGDNLVVTLRVKGCLLYTSVSFSIIGIFPISISYFQSHPCLLYTSCIAVET